MLSSSFRFMRRVPAKRNAVLNVNITPCTTSNDTFSSASRGALVEGNKNIRHPTMAYMNSRRQHFLLAYCVASIPAMANVKLQMVLESIFRIWRFDGTRSECFSRSIRNETHCPYTSSNSLNLFSIMLKVLVFMNCKN